MLSLGEIEFQRSEAAGRIRRLWVDFTHWTPVPNWRGSGADRS
jgi:hypothetical protein